jgi:hypothetical protein
MECNKCGSRIGEFYRCEDGIYCFDCLLKELKIEEYTITHYKRSDEYISKNDISDYLEEIGITIVDYIEAYPINNIRLTPETIGD